ncbi:MAG: DUF1549 domain-containing protein, partial [Planctomycetota bacterium]
MTRGKIPPPTDPSRRLLELADRMFETGLSAEERGELEQLVLRSARLRRLYVEYVDLHGTLYWDAVQGNALRMLAGTSRAAVASAYGTAGCDAECEPELHTPTVPAAAHRRRFPVRWLVAALLVLAVTLWSVSFDRLGRARHVVNTPSAAPAGGKPAPDQPGIPDVRTPTIARDQLPTDRRPPTGHPMHVPSQAPDLLSVPRGRRVAARGADNDGSVPASSKRSPNEPAAPPTKAMANVAHTGSDPASPEPPDGPPQRPAPTAVSISSVVRLIDQRIAAGWREAGVEPSPVADDAEWFRRLHLDLVGRIPSRERLLAFLKDSSPNKRQRWVDRLLDDPDYVGHWAMVWTNTLVGRTPRGDADRDALERF